MKILILYSGRLILLIVCNHGSNKTIVLSDMLSDSIKYQDL